MTPKASPTALFPEPSFGAALAFAVSRALRARRHWPVFLHAGFSQAFADHGFQERQLRAQRAGETSVGHHVGRDAWTEGVLE